MIFSYHNYSIDRTPVSIIDNITLYAKIPGIHILLGDIRRKEFPTLATLDPQDSDLGL